MSCHKQNKTKQNKTKQNKTKQNKTKQNKTNQIKSNQIKSNQSNQIKTNQIKSNQIKSNQIKTNQVLQMLHWIINPPGFSAVPFPQQQRKIFVSSSFSSSFRYSKIFFCPPFCLFFDRAGCSLSLRIERGCPRTIGALFLRLFSGARKEESKSATLRFCSSGEVGATLAELAGEL